MKPSTRRFAIAGPRHFADLCRFCGSRTSQAHPSEFDCIRQLREHLKSIPPRRPYEEENARAISSRDAGSSR